MASFYCPKKQNQIIVALFLFPRLALFVPLTLQPKKSTTRRSAMNEHVKSVAVPGLSAKLGRGVTQ